MKTIYLSGPVSGRSEREYSLHFYKVADEIYRRAGIEGLAIETFNPVPHCRVYVEPGAPWHECMRICVSQLARCDGIALLQGWESSRGARLELELADTLKIPVVYIEPPFGAEDLARLPGELDRYHLVRCARCLEDGFSEEFAEDRALAETANRYLDPHGFEYLDGPEPVIAKEGNDGEV
jgi:hypothetical protein